jgi:histone-lysine N-methyltransferase SETMAR
MKRPTIARRALTSKTVLYAIFFNSNGLVTQYPVPKSRSVISYLYSKEILPRLHKYYQKRRPKTGFKGIKLWHDNVPAHKAKATQDYLQRHKVVVLLHPAYSPDLTPCDFFLFPKLKDALSGRRFLSRSALGSAVFQYLRTIPKQSYRNVFYDWLKRLKLSVQHKGDFL